jgi:hypothetical protein
MVCVPCRRGDCNECVDILRLAYTEVPVCQCTRQNHNGEPINQQILDPETGTVYAPGLEVTRDGEVKFHGRG